MGSPSWLPAAAGLDCTPRSLGTLRLSISLARGSGACGGGLAFSLIEANSPLYSIEMPHFHLPSLLGSVVEVLSSICSQIGE